LTIEDSDVVARRSVVLDLTDPDDGEAAGRRQEADAFRRDVLAGLAGEQKTIPSKYLYDARGAELFEQICEQPEYYPTRTEMALLDASGPGIAAAVGPGAAVVEPGSGAGEKVRLLLDALEAPSAYVPVDISREQLRRVARSLSSVLDGVPVVPLWADFTHHVDVPDDVAGLHPRLVFFPGSTIGNFLPAVQRELLEVFGELAGEGGRLLIGYDRIKDPGILLPAYDDAAGVTAAFELNILERMNRELDAGFDPSAFRYEARYDREAARVEMHLVSLRPQEVAVAGQRFAFRAGESIWNESSHKFDDKRFSDLASSAGLVVERSWTDADGLFTLAMLRAA